jgi:hypothetical protein
MSKKSRGEIFILSSTLKDSLEYRLKQSDGYVEGTDMKKKRQRKGIAKGMVTYHIPYVLD